MNYQEPLGTLQEVKIAWINLADNYKSIGDEMRAYEVLKELVYLSDKNAGPAVMRDHYFKHYQEWESYRGFRMKIA